MRKGEVESAPSMNNADLGSAKHRGCARTSGSQLELEESTVHSIERNEARCAAARARLAGLLAQRGRFDLL